MRGIARRLVGRAAQAIGARVLSFSERRKIDEISAVDKGMQILLSSRYQELLHLGLPRPKLGDVEFRSFSQNGEDGILLYIFSLLGTTNRRSVEIGVGDGVECNTANLIVNHGWTGLLIDGDQQSIERGRNFYSHSKNTRVWPPALVHEWVTVENVNSLIRRNGFEGEIDLLSLDIDGMDYWIWKAIDCISPRVVVLEYQDIWGPEKSVTVPYKPNFRAEFTLLGPDYCGASLSAFVKLGREKGYRLVGCQTYGFNAFFVRVGIGEESLPEISPAECFQHPKVRYGMQNRLPRVVDLEWVEV